MDSQSADSNPFHLVLLIVLKKKLMLFFRVRYLRSMHVCRSAELLSTSPFDT